MSRKKVCGRIYNMKAYKTKTKKSAGTSYPEIRKKAFGLYKKIKHKSKRKPYIKSVYFKKDKIFLDLFWSHLFKEKNYWDQMRRMKFFACGIELIRKSNIEPISKENPNKYGEILHRFAGASRDNELFFVQIKEDKKTSKKWLISIFPIEKWK